MKQLSAVTSIWEPRVHKIHLNITQEKLSVISFSVTLKTHIYNNAWHSIFYNTLNKSSKIQNFNGTVAAHLFGFK